MVEDLIGDAWEVTSASTLRYKLSPQGQAELVAEQGVLRAPAGMGFAVLEDLADAFAAGFQEHASGALAADSGQEVQQELVAGEGAVGHVVERDGVGQLPRAVELQSVCEEEQPDLGAGDGVVAVSDRIDDCLVDDVEVVVRLPAGESSLLMNRATKAIPASI